MRLALTPQTRARPPEESIVLLRVGREAYGANLHFDLLDNWILGVRGRKRVVLAHPRWHDCVRVDEDTNSSTFRQSPMPLLRAREWLAEHCPQEDEDGPRAAGVPLAMQHVVEEGDGDRPSLPPPVQTREKSHDLRKEGEFIQAVAIVVAMEQIPVNYGLRSDKTSSGPPSGGVDVPGADDDDRRLQLPSFSRAPINLH